MTTQQKIIRNKVGVLELAQHLGNVSKACRVNQEPGRRGRREGGGGNGR